MKQRFLISVFTAFLTLFFGAFTILQTSSAHAAVGSVKLSQHKASPQKPDWITKAEPYIHINNGVATIDLAINGVLTKDDVKKVEQSVARYNALSLNEKTLSVKAYHISTNIVHPTSNCSSGGTIYGPYHYWWGTAYTADHCMITYLDYLRYIGDEAAIIAVICGFLSGGLCAIIEGVASIVIYRTVSDLDYYDSNCGQRGANINFPYPGGFFINGVC